MKFLQQNLYVWETMISSAAYQLSEGNTKTPAAIVFEPPGRGRNNADTPRNEYDIQVPDPDRQPKEFGEYPLRIPPRCRETNR